MRRALASVLLLLMIISNARAANFEVGPPGGNWNKVQILPLKADITIELKRGGEISGEFIRLTEDSILFTEYGREKSCLKNMVSRVLWMRPGSRLRKAGIVGGIFFGLGFGLGYASAANVADQNSMPAGERAAVGAGIGALIGGAAAVISIAHRPGPRSELVYRAR